MGEVEKNLPTLAGRINEEHRACEKAVGAALTHAMNAGELLVEVKASLPHGAFGPWLAENFAGSDRTARAYMRVHSHRDELEAKRQSSATLSIDGALKALVTPQPQPVLEEIEAMIEAGELEEAALATKRLLKELGKELESAEKSKDVRAVATVAAVAGRLQARWAESRLRWERKVGQLLAERVGNE
jgi:hypothetical protein